MIKRIKSRFRYSIILLKQLVKTDFKLRYQGSILGYMWSLLRPLLLFLILYVVFVKFLKFKADIPHYSIYLLLGVVLWNFFAETTSQSLTSIVARGDVIRKIRIPRWTIVISSSIGALINFFLSMLVVIAFMIFDGVDVTRTIVLFPLLVLELYLLSLGLALLLSALFVKYRDISYIWEVILQAGFYATPIIYPLSLISNIDFQKLLLLNPIAQIVQDARYSVVSHLSPTVSSVYSEGFFRIIPLSVVVFIFFIGLFYFKKQSKSFAENL